MRVFVLAIALSAASPVAADQVASRAGLDGFVTLDRLPIPDQPELALGREIWGDSCENCHGGNKLTGAPKITSTKAWAPRIEQGLALLVQHASEGFIGPKYKQMPARGGNPDLSDTDVAQAVAFMVWASGGAQIARDYIENSKKD